MKLINIGLWNFEYKKSLFSFNFTKLNLFYNKVSKAFFIEVFGIFSLREIGAFMVFSYFFLFYIWVPAFYSIQIEIENFFVLSFIYSDVLNFVSNSDSSIMFKIQNEYSYTSNLIIHNMNKRAIQNIDITYIYFTQFLQMLGLSFCNLNATFDLLYNIDNSLLFFLKKFANYKLNNINSIELYLHNSVINLFNLGISLYTYYGFLLIILGFILLISMIGIIVLTVYVDFSVKTQDMTLQVINDSRSIIKQII